MYRFSGFTGKANNAINCALTAAQEMGHTYIGSEHLLLGLLREGSGAAYAILTQRGLGEAPVAEKIADHVGRGTATTLSTLDLSPACRRMLDRASSEARGAGSALAGTEHLLLALLSERECSAVRYLTELGVDCRAVTELARETIRCDLAGQAQEKLRRVSGRAVRPAGKSVNLDRYGVDMTELARQGRLDPVVGREKEIERVMQILSRRTKNNPCLIGEAGVGKTAVVEALAQKIAADETPEGLWDKRIISLDLTCMVAGTKYRGDFEERIRQVVEEAVNSGDVILFIDEIHTIVGVGAAEGAVDAANILKPQLARGELHVIGATTIAEYRKTIEKDGALARRFQSVMVEEPTPAQTVEIIRGLRERYERHHHVVISDEAIHAAVELSQRYLPARFLPDKAIDLIDEAASCARLHSDGAQDTISRELRESLLALRKEKEAEGEYRAYEMAMTAGQRGRGGDRRTLIGTEEIATAVSAATGISLARIGEKEAQRYLSLERRLSELVVGQNEAVRLVSAAIRRSRVGLKNPKRPSGSFLFLGPTGVGKTQLCRALGEALFGSRDSIIKLDMSEYMERHSVSRLIGAPPGYIGCDEGGQLTEQVRKKPFSVVLLDEIEKAHPDIYNLLLQIMEDGELTDSQGRKAQFGNTVLIMTSNIGAEFITRKNALGFNQRASGKEAPYRNDVMNAAKKVFSPEFLGRVEEIVLFEPLSRAELARIARMLLDEVAARLREIGVQAEFSDAVAELVAESGADGAYGARPLRRAVRTCAEDRLAQAILSGAIKSGDHITCDVVDGAVIISGAAPFIYP